MKMLWQGLMLCGCLSVLNAAHAYTLTCDNSGTSCAVTCDDGQSVGTMYWNGTQWSDGIRADPEKDKLAKQMVAAQGTSCH